MTRAFDLLWQPLDPHRIAYEDATVVVVDKPVGLPVEAGGDSLTQRVRRHIAARDGVEPSSVYLGAHQHLARDSSGAVLFVRARSANAAMAAQSTKTHFHPAILVRVANAPPAFPATLEGFFSTDHSGVPHPAPAKGPGTRWGRIRVAERSRNGDLALLDVTLERGAVVQVRAHLEACHSRLATVPNGVAFHVRSITFDHPTTAASVTVNVPDPSWADPPPLAVALHRALERRHGLALDEGTDAFRLVNEAGDDVPFVTVDRYGDFALVQRYRDDDAEAFEHVLDAVHALGARGVYAKWRPHHASTLSEVERARIAPSEPVRGEAAPDTFTITENGLKYAVRLGAGLSTGLFLDQRENRRRIREIANGVRFLNLFAYTGAFTVAAAAGGAARTVTVDASANAIARARNNLALNALTDDARHVFATADVFGWIQGARARREQYDLVVLDPPSFSTTRDGGTFSAASDYCGLAAQVMAVVAPGGSILACSNHRGIPHGKFRRYLYQAALEAGRVVKRARDQPDPLDFPAPAGREVHLKCVLVTLE